MQELSYVARSAHSSYLLRSVFTIVFLLIYKNVTVFAFDLTWGCFAALCCGLGPSLIARFPVALLCYIAALIPADLPSPYTPYALRVQHTGRNQEGGGKEGTM